MDIKKLDNYSVPVMFQKLNEMDTSDGRFTKVRIWMMHLQDNYNGSIFERPVVDNAIPSIEYIPIVGFIEKNSLGEDDFSDHRYIITKKDGNVEKKYAGSAYGVILSSEDNNAHYEDRLCDDGITRTFLVVDGIIWNMFDKSSEIINRDLVKSHSMELWDSIEGWEDENNLFHFTKFSFRAACILGNDQEPGMHNSTIEVQFTMSDFVKSIQSELSNKLKTYTDYVKQNNNKGGTQMAKPEETKTDFSLTAMQQFSEIDNIVSAHEQYRDRWGDLRVRYSAVDLQNDEVICIDRAENYTYFGFKFAMNGDKPTVDFATKTRKKIEYTNFEEGTQVIESAFSFANEVEDFCKTADKKIGELTTEKETAETNYSSIKSEYDEIKPKYEDFVKEKAENEKKAVELKKDECFAKFDEHLSTVDEYTALKNEKDNLSLDQIEAKCAILFTQKSLSTNFTKKQKNNDTLTADIVDYSSNDEGVVQTKYGAIKVSK